MPGRRHAPSPIAWQDSRTTSFVGRTTRVRWLRRVLDELDQQADGLAAHLLDRLLDRGQRGAAERRLRDVVEPDDREVLRDREAERAGDGHGLERSRVVGGEDRRRPRVELEQLARRSGGRLGLVATDADEALVDCDARSGEGLAVAPFTQSRRLEVGASRQERDPPVSEADQVLGRGNRAVQVVGVDGRQGRGVHVVVDRDHRRSEHLVDAAGRDEDRTVGERPADAREVAALPAALVARAAGAGEHDELVVRVVDRPRDALEQLGAERLDVGDEHAEDVGAPASQALADEARVVAELLDHRAHARRGVLGDAVAVVYHLRDRGDRDPGLRRDLTNRHPTASHGWGIYTDLETDIDNG